MTKEQFEEAFQIWASRLPTVETNKALLPFLNAPTLEGWLRKARTAQCLTMAQVAAQLKVAPTSYCSLERREIAGTVTLRSLSKAAEAMGCELVYAIRPKAKTTFARVLWEEYWPKAARHNLFKIAPEPLKAQKLAAIAGFYFRNAVRSSPSSDGGFRRNWR